MSNFIHAGLIPLFFLLIFLRVMIVSTINFEVFLSLKAASFLESTGFYSSSHRAKRCENFYITWKTYPAKDLKSIIFVPSAKPKVSTASENFSDDWKGMQIRNYISSILLAQLADSLQCLAQVQFLFSLFLHFLQMSVNLEWLHKIIQEEIVHRSCEGCHFQ